MERQQKRQSAGSHWSRERGRLVQMLLDLVLHAHECLTRENQTGHSQCNFPQCKTMKSVLSHMKTCKAGRSCTFGHCAFTRRIIGHWMQCNCPNCLFCFPLRLGGGFVATDSNERVTTRQSSNPTLEDMLLAFEVLSIGIPTTSNGAGPTDNAPTTSGMSSGQNPQNQVGDGLGQPHLGSTPSSAQTAESTELTITNILQIFFGPGQDVRSGYGDGRHLPPGPSGGENPLQGAKEWHRSVTPQLRDHLVHKLVQAIFPAPDPQPMLENRMYALACARKVEQDIFEMANSRAEYYQLVAQKAYQIRSTLENTD